MQIYTKSPSHQYISAVDAFHIAELRKMYVYLHWFIVGHCPALGPAEVRLERFWLLLFYGQLSSSVCIYDSNVPTNSLSALCENPFAF